MSIGHRKANRTRSDRCTRIIVPERGGTPDRVCRKTLFWRFSGIVSPYRVILFASVFTFTLGLFACASQKTGCAGEAPEWFVF